MINIGGVAVTPKDGFTIDRNKLEERDSGQLETFNTRSERFEPYDLVTIDGIDEQFVVQSDNVIRHRDGLFEHQITLIEAIATFDGFYPADRIFSADPPKTLGEVLTVYKTELENYHNLFITFDTEADWTDTPVRQKEFVGVNFGVIVADLFRTLDAKPRAKFENGEWEIFPDFYNERRNLITPNPVSDLLAQDNLDYASRVKTQIKNGVYESQRERFFPSPNGSILPKSEGPQRIDSKMQFELDSGIIEITEAIVTDINIRGVDNGVPFFALQNIDVDITKHVVPKPLWDGKPAPASQFEDGVHKKNSLFYDIGSRFIKNLFIAESEVAFFIFNDNNEVLQNAVIETLWEADTTYGENNEFNIRDLPKSTWQIRHGDALTTDDFDLGKIQMRFKYIPQRSFDVVHHRQFLKNMNEITQIHRQRDSQTEVERYKNVLKNLSNRMGNDIKQFTQVFTDTDPFDLGDYDVNDNVVVRVKNTFYNDHTLCEFMMSEGFGNIDGEASLWKEPSPFEIQSKDITTNIIIEEFIEISRESKDVSTRLRPAAIKSVLSTLDSSVDTEPPVKAAIMRPITGAATLVTATGVYLPAFTGGGGNTTSFHFQIDDPVSAGRAFKEALNNDDRFGVDLIYTLPPESERFGELDDFFIFLIPDVDFTDDGAYPLVPTGLYNGIAEQALTQTNIVDTINKDKNAKFAVTFQQHFVTDDPDIIIGAGLAKYNRLFTDVNIPTLKIYRSTVPYSIFDNKIRPDDVLVGGGVSVDDDTRQLSITAGLPFGQPELEYVAIAFDDEIVLAFNDFGGVNEQFFINFTDAAEREIVNQLPAPSIFGSSSTSDSLTFAVTNLSPEGVTLEATLDGVTQTEEVGGNDGDPLNIPQYTNVFTFSGLSDPNTSYQLNVRALPLPGSEFAPSTFAVAFAATDILPIDVPTFEEKDFVIQTGDRIDATYTVTNSNDFPVEVFARVNNFEYSVGTISANSSGDVVVDLSGDNQFIFEGVAYTIDMRFRTTSFLNNWFSDYSDVDTLLIEPHAVPSFVSSSATDVSTTWVWKNESDFTSEIEIDLFAELPGINVFIETKSAFTLAGLNATVTFTGLDPETTYKTTAKALQRGFKTDSDLSDFSPTITTDPPTTATPGFTLDNRTQNSLEFTFTNEDAATVDIYWNLTGNPGPNDNVIEDVGPGDPVSASATGLDSGEVYTIFRRAQAAGKLISSVGQSTTSTLGQHAKPVFITSSVTTDSLTVQWGNPNDVPVVMETRLQIGASPVPDTTKTTNIAANDGASVTYEGLNPNSTFNMIAKFLADADNVESDTENTPPITTDQEQTATPSITNIIPQTDSVSFTLVNNDTETVTMEWGLGAFTESATVTNQTTTGFSNLDPDTPYTIQARATAAGKSVSEVEEEPFTTDPLPLATQWVFRSPTTEDETVDRGFVAAACPTTSDNQSFLTGQIDPTTKPIGYVVKVTSSTDDGFGGLEPCTDHYFEAQ